MEFLTANAKSLLERPNHNTTNVAYIPKNSSAKVKDSHQHHHQDIENDDEDIFLQRNKRKELTKTNSIDSSYNSHKSNQIKNKTIDNSYHKGNNPHNNKLKIPNKDLPIERKKMKTLKKNNSEKSFDFSANLYHDKSDNSFEEKVKNLQNMNYTQKRAGEHERKKLRSLSKNKLSVVDTNHKKCLLNKQEKELNNTKKTISTISTNRAKINTDAKNDKLRPSVNVSKTELVNLKKEINKLKFDNEKLRESLNAEKKKNEKFKEFAEDFIKYYEY
jgi:hypothetical protein